MRPAVKPRSGRGGSGSERVSGRVSIKAVASEAGVSPGTVSNVLNHPELVRPVTRDRVLATMSALGYVRNEAARLLRAGSSRTLAMIVLDAWNPFFADIARGVEDVAVAEGWTVLLANSHRNADREVAYLREFAERRVAGMLISPYADLTVPLRTLRQGGMESVLLDARASDPDGLSVSVDDVEGGRLAASHLLELGHRQLAFGGDPAAVSHVRDRLRGVRIALANTDLPGDVTVLPTLDLTVEGGAEVAQQLLALSKPHRPTALFAASDMVAIGALHELVRGGLQVPDDIAIVGYDDNVFAKQVLVPLTTVRQPAYEMGHLAAQMLLGRLQGLPLAQSHPVFQPELVVRESTDRRLSSRRLGRVKQAT